MADKDVGILEEKTNDKDEKKSETRSFHFTSSIEKVKDVSIQFFRFLDSLNLSNSFKKLIYLIFIYNKKVKTAVDNEPQHNRIPHVFCNAYRSKQCL